MMKRLLAQFSAFVVGAMWAGMACAGPLPETPVNSWGFLRNFNGAALFGGDTNTPILGPADNQSPDTLEAAAIAGTWGGAIALQIGEVARVTGGVVWAETGDGSPGLRFGLFNSDGNLLDGSPGYMAFLGNQTDNTFDRTTTASTAGYVFSPLVTQNLNATVLDEQGTWQDQVFSEFKIEVKRTGSDSTEIRFQMSSLSGDPVSITAVATHSAANGGAAARTFNFNTFGMQFSAASNGPDSASFFDVNIAVFLPGDYNGNGTVDAADYTVWRNSLGQSGSGLAADGDGNRIIDAADYVLWKTNFGQTASSGSAAILPAPEPRTMLLWSAVVLSAGLVRRR